MHLRHRERAKDSHDLDTIFAALVAAPFGEGLEVVDSDFSAVAVASLERDVPMPSSD